MEDLFKEGESDVDKIDSVIDKKLTKIKHQAFGKCSKKSTKSNSEASNLMKLKSETKSDEDRVRLDEEIDIER